MRPLCGFVLAVLFGDTSGWAQEAALSVRELPTIQRTLRVSKAVGTLDVSPQDSLLFLGTLPPAEGGSLAYGDTDQDGAEEIIMQVFDPEIPLTIRILEHQMGVGFQEALRWDSSLLPYAVCDLDQDGKREILCQDVDRLALYESPTASSHPTNIVWTSPPLSNIIGYTTVGDTDRDGNLEIIHSINTLGYSLIVILENAGDNTFNQVFLDTTMDVQAHGRKVIADFDADGLVEIALSGTAGYLHVYESPSDDVWQEVFVDSTELDNAYGIAGGLDTDGNGRPELFVAGNGWDEQTQTSIRNIYVYEAPVSNTYVRVRTLVFDDGQSGGLTNGLVVTNIDNVGLPELVINFFRQINIYRAPGPGQWNMTVAAIAPTPSYVGHIHAFDANHNGLPEVFWLSELSTLTTSFLLEHPGVSPTDASPIQFLGTEQLVISPTPARGRATILLGPRAATAATIAVYDVAGRLMARERLSSGRSASYFWNVRSLESGNYFIRAEGRSREPLATGRALVIR